MHFFHRCTTSFAISEIAESECEILSMSSKHPKPCIYNSIKGGDTSAFDVD